MNAANEVAVAAFLDGHIAFTAIARLVARVTRSFQPPDKAGLEQLLAADRWARDQATELVTEASLSAPGVAPL
jgi:1-deoxy-D-xylulose-5-phosphate reductoisomerase